MSTITRELAKLFRKITNSEIDAEGNAHVVLSPADSLLINNARIALASLEAEPVAWAHRLINKRNGVVHPWVYGSAEACPSEGDIFNIEVTPLYTAPPAPVALTSGYSDFEEIWSSSTHPLTQDDEMKDFAWDIWNACRAAILQGAEPVQGWIPCSDRMPTKNHRVLIFINFNSDTVPPSIHDAQFTGSTFRRGNATVNVFPLEDGYGVTHWMPLPAAPQQGA